VLPQPGRLRQLEPRQVSQLLQRLRPQPPPAPVAPRRNQPPKRKLPQQMKPPLRSRRRRRERRLPAKPLPPRPSQGLPRAVPPYAPSLQTPQTAHRLAVQQITTAVSQHTAEAAAAPTASATRTTAQHPRPRSYPTVPPSSSWPPMLRPLPTQPRLAIAAGSSVGQPLARLLGVVRQVTTAEQQAASPSRRATPRVSRSNSQTAKM
jgi:hypothetical protein